MKNIIFKKANEAKQTLKRAAAACLLFVLPIQVATAGRFVAENWYNIDENIEETSLNACNTAYKIVVSKQNASSGASFGLKDTELSNEWLENGSTVKVLEGADVSVSGITFGPKSSGEETITFYINLQTMPYEITGTEPATDFVAVISADKTGLVTVGTDLNFSLAFCSKSGETVTAATYQWQVSEDSKVWQDVEGATEESLDFSVVYDMRYVRLQMDITTDVSTYTLTSNEYMINVSEPSVSFHVEDAVKINEVEYEFQRWQSFKVYVDNEGSLITGVDLMECTFAQMSDDLDTTFVTATTAQKIDGENGWVVTADQSYEYQIGVYVDMPYFDGTVKSTFVKSNITARMIYSCDADVKSEVLFSDDFGHFDNLSNTYIYVDTEGESQEVPVEADVFDNASGKLWSKDFNSYVQGHDYAMDDPLIGPFASDNCASDGYQHYNCWSDGYRIEDGFYGIVANPAAADGGNNDYWNGNDHTGDAVVGTQGGAMLFVNCAKNTRNKVVYRRDFTINSACANSMVLFSAFVSNAVKNTWNETLKSNNGPVNVRIDIRDALGTLIGSVSSGDVQRRDYGINNWSHLTTAFALSSGNTYTMELTNNMDGGAGNDILLDDISVTICYPSITLRTNADDEEVTSEDTAVICGNDRTLTLKAFNKAGIKNYIPMPYYKYQYYNSVKDAWSDLTDVIEEDNIDITLSKADGKFTGVNKFRVIVAESAATIANVETALAAGSTLPTVECGSVYAIDSSMTVIFRPMGDNLSYDGCIGDQIAVKANSNGRPKTAWYDLAGNEISTVNDSIIALNGDDLTFEILKSINKYDTLLYVGTELTGCADTQKVSIHKYDDVIFTIDSQDTYCEFGEKIPATDVYPTSGINYVWHLAGSSLADQTESEYTITQADPEIFDNVLYVTADADGYCPISDTIKYSIYKKFTLDLSINSEDSEDDICLPASGVGSKVELNVTKSYVGETPSYANELPTTYYWYRKTAAGQELLAQTTEPKYTDNVTDNNIYKYVVSSSDGVCYTPTVNADGTLTGDVSTSDTTIANVRKKIEFDLTAAPETLCVGESVTFNMTAINAITADIDVTWTEDGTLVETTTETPATVTHTPANETNFKLTRTMEISTDDKICNETVSKSVSYTIYKPISIELLSDADKLNDRNQKCINEDNKDNYVNLDIKVNAGNPTSYVWSDGLYEGLVGSRQFIVSPGNNKISVVAFDEVCNKSAAAVEQDAKDSIEIVAQKAIKIDLAIAKNKLCDQEAGVFTLTVENALDNKTSVIWEEDAAKVLTTVGNSGTQAYVVSNTGLHKVTKKMEVKVLDDICRTDGSYETASVTYDIYKPIQFTLTSDAANNQQCMTSDAKRSVNLTVTVTQGDPTSYVWSDGEHADETQRPFAIAVGTNTISVTAYDEVCNINGVAAGEQYDGENQNISIEAREPITIALALTSGRQVMCVGEEIALTATVTNSHPTEKTKLTWSEDHGAASGSVTNGDYATQPFAPAVGATTITVTAAEDAAVEICPAQSASYTATAQSATTISIESDNYAVCQDLTSDDTKAEITLTAHVLTGNPDAIVWSTGDRTLMEGGVSHLTVVPEDDIIYTAYGSDEICATTQSVATPKVTVSHRIYIDLSVEETEVQIGDSVRLNVTTSRPYAGVYTWMQTSPSDEVIGTTDVPHYAYYMPEKGAYSFSVSIDNDNCGVIVSNETSIDVADYRVVPNVITPYNGNIKNDTFMRGYDVQIFDRYQQVIYSGSDGWDGTYRGQTATPGTYFYIITKKDGRVLKGTVEVYK